MTEENKTQDTEFKVFNLEELLTETIDDDTRIALRVDTPTDDFQHFPLPSYGTFFISFNCSGEYDTIKSRPVPIAEIDLSEVYRFVLTAVINSGYYIPTRALQTALKPIYTKYQDLRQEVNFSQKEAKNFLEKYSSDEDKQNSSD
jgi:hypothetical protein